MDAKRHITVDFGGTNMRIAHVGADLRDVRVIPSKSALDREALRAHFLGALHGYFGDYGLDGGIDSINVAIAGQIDTQNGVVLASPNLPSWKDVPLKAWLEAEFKLPAYIDNDVRAAALGELYYSGLEGVRDMVCLYWGTGIGGGIIAGGHLLRGVSNAAGEVGHMVYQPRGRRCHCGKRGCFEAYAGGWAIAEIAQEAVALQPIQELGETPTTAAVFMAANEGNAVAERIRSEAAHAFAVLAANLVVAFNPEVLILGGGLTGHYPEILRFVHQAVEEYALAADKLRLRVKLSEMDDKAALFGAAQLGRS